MTRFFTDYGWLLAALALCLCSCSPRPSARDREILWALEQFQRTTAAMPEHALIDEDGPR